MKIRIFRAVLLLLIMGLMCCESQQIRSEENSLKGTEKSPADVYVSLGIEYINRGMNDVALEKLQMALDVDRSSSNAHNVIAVLYDRLGERLLAEKHFEKAVKLTPTNSSAQTNYANFLCKNNQFGLADEHYNLAIRNPLYKQAVVALTNAGKCAWDAGNLEKAEDYYRKALQRNGRYSPALFMMAELKFERKKYLSVRAYLQRYREVARHTSASLWLGIQTEDKLGNSDGVASYILQLKEMHPDSNEMVLLEKSKFYDESTFYNSPQD